MPLPAPTPIWSVIQPFLWPFMIALAGTVITTPIVRMIAFSANILDKPDAILKPHAKPIPYLGGVAIYIGWTAGLLSMLWLTPPAEHSEATRNIILHILAAGTLMMLTGLVDDIRDLKPKTKLLLELAAACILIHGGIGRTICSMLLSPLGINPGALGILVSSFFIVLIVMGAANSTNLIDGLDGLCSGVTGIISIGFVLIASHLASHGFSASGDPVRLAVAFALLGACLGFLRYNFNPAQVFMGDAGSLLLGLNAAVMLLLFAEKSVFRWFLGACMVFALPVFDTALAITRRKLNGKPLFLGDRSHFYDQLRDRGFSVRQTVLICYLLAAGLAAVGCVVIYVRFRYSIIIFAAVVIAAVITVSRLGMLRVDRPPPPPPS